MPAKKAKKQKQPKPNGRPTKYTDQVAAEINAAVSTCTAGLAAICANNSAFPEARTVYRWLATNPKFCQMYESAKEQQVLLLGEEMLEIADETARDTIETEQGERANSEWIARSRLRVDTRKWLMSKLAPRKYGDRSEVALSGNVGSVHLTLAEWKARDEQAKEWERKGNGGTAGRLPEGA